MARCCSCTWPIPAPIYGPLLLLYIAHSYPHKLYIASAKRLVQIRHKAWRFLTAFLIVLIFVPLNGACMRAYIGHMGAAMGHAYAHTWPYMGAAMGYAYAHTWPYMGAAMGIYTRIYGHRWGSPIGRAGKGFLIIPFPSLLRGRELPSLRFFSFLSPVPFFI